jgi:hypothetical protein
MFLQENLTIESNEKCHACGYIEGEKNIINTLFHRETFAEVKGHFIIGSDDSYYPDSEIRLLMCPNCGTIKGKDI